ncbi:hypothetical protein J1N35_005580 [Gossypium stocksii]|uniref:Uncharacterized protein n=1 Tax=Gossypium stocksii TaxID=47602 RepID=A0A9D4AJE2_9ROSI|nr:hypothetical protein J1N35_005580 [Gossypium stocksii]
MAEALSFNIDALQTFLNTAMGELAKKNDAFKVEIVAIKEENEAAVTILNTKIEELEGELVVCRVVVGNGVLSATSSHKINVPKSKYKGARSMKEVNFLLGIRVILTCNRHQGC